MEIPREILEVVQTASAKFPDDIPAAIDYAEKHCRRLPDWADYEAGIITHSIQQLVYADRHRVDVAIRRQAGHYGGPAQVHADGESVLEAYRSYYGYFLQGKTLGTIIGAEFADIADIERGLAAGHEFNAELADVLGEMVPAEKTVREFLPEKKLARVFGQVRRGMQHLEPSGNGQAKTKKREGVTV